MITRRKLFGLVAGAVVAPKELLASPLAGTPVFSMEMLQKAYAAAKFAGPEPNLMAYPMMPEECFFATPIFITSPRTMFKITGLKLPDDKEEVSC